MTPAQSYERFFVPVIAEPMARALLEAAALRQGERVLDVGCGTGIVARLAAEQVGPKGFVAGADPNPGMIAVARSVATSHPTIEWHEAPGESLPLSDGSFDVVLCQMSLQFFADRTAGLREMHRVLAAGGRLALNVPGPAAPMFEVLARALGQHVAPEAAGFVHAVFGLNDEPEIAALLEAAGFRDVATRADTRELILPAPRDFLWQYIGSTPLAAVAGGADPDTRNALERDVVAGWQEFADDGGMRARQRMVTATARR